VLHVLDPHEQTFPYEGLTEFHALESTNRMLVNPAAIRKDYLDKMAVFLAKTKQGLTSAGIDYHLASTDKPLEQTLLDLMIARSRLGPGRRAS
jgi:hypothetical protein